MKQLKELLVRLERYEGERRAQAGVEVCEPMDTSAHRVLFGARHRADGLIMNWWITYAAVIVAWYVGGPLLSLAVWVALVAKALWDRQEAINARLSRLTREPHDNASEDF